MPPLSQAERRLAAFCRIAAALHLAAAALFAFAPGAAYRLASMGEAVPLPPEAVFWSSLAAASMVAVGVACLVVARDPRALRHALLPVVAAKLASSCLALAHLGSGRAPGALLLVDLPLLCLTLVVYRASSPGVNARAAAARPPAAEQGQEAGRVQLGVPK